MLSSVIEKQVVPSNNNDSATDLLPLPAETGFLFKIIYLEIIIFVQLITVIVQILISVPNSKV